MLGDDHAKSNEATYRLVCQTCKSEDELIVQLRALWECSWRTLGWSGMVSGSSGEHFGTKMSIQK